MVFNFFLFEYILKSNWFLWFQWWIFSIITPNTQSFRNHLVWIAVQEMYLYSVFFPAWRKGLVFVAYCRCQCRTSHYAIQKHKPWPVFFFCCCCWYSGISRASWTPHPQIHNKCQRCHSHKPGLNTSHNSTHIHFPILLYSIWLIAARL